MQRLNQAEQPVLCPQCGDGIAQGAALGAVEAMDGVREAQLLAVVRRAWAGALAAMGACAAPGE
jgi:hypothetical protein